MEKPSVHVKYNSQPPVFICDHCGQTKQIDLPKTISELTQEMDEFEKQHLTCGGTND